MGTPGPEPGSQIDGLFQLFGLFYVLHTVVQKDLAAYQQLRLLYLADMLITFQVLRNCTISNSTFKNV